MQWHCDLLVFCVLDMKNLLYVVVGLVWFLICYFCCDIVWLGSNAEISIEDIVAQRDDIDYYRSLDDMILTWTIRNASGHDEHYLFVKWHVTGRLRIVNLPCDDHPCMDFDAWRAVLDVDPQEPLYRVLGDRMTGFGQLNDVIKTDPSLRNALVLWWGRGRAEWYVWRNPHETGVWCSESHNIRWSGDVVTLNTSHAKQDRTHYYHTQAPVWSMSKDQLSGLQLFSFVALLWPEDMYFAPSYVSLVWLE